MTATATIPTPNRINNQVQGQFYPLQRDELIAMKRNRMIGNVPYVHFALRYENPYCDRPIEIISKEFAVRWEIPESSIYEALTKLKKLGILALKTGRVLMQWLSPDATTSEVQNIEQNLEEQIKSKTPEQNPETQENSEIPESISDPWNSTQKPITEPDSSENRKLEPLSEALSSLSKTIQNTKTNQTTKRDEIVDKLEEAGIPVQDDVMEAVRSHHRSQVLKAIAIIADRDDISYKKGYFLSIVGKQPIERLGSAKEYRASDACGYTLEHIKAMYPNSWKEAAEYFGVDL